MVQLSGVQNNTIISLFLLMDNNNDFTDYLEPIIIYYFCFCIVLRCTLFFNPQSGNEIKGIERTKTRT